MASKIYPSFSDYQSALQHPKLTFSRNFLRDCEVESDLWGFPRVRSGGFTLTYKVSVENKSIAVRCFHRGVRDRASRYALISRSIEDSRLPFFVPTRYFHSGILINAKTYPITTLNWIEGESLENYIFHKLDDAESLSDLGDKFRGLCMSLEKTGFAHGDLSHRNIMVKSGEIYLIDYDGMFVPGLEGKKSSELGNIHFQHPSRTNLLFNSKMDRFSSIVIYLAIKSLQIDPTLWENFQTGGEGLLFQQSDFNHPGQSKIFFRLEKFKEISKLIHGFRNICSLEPDSVPSLEEFLGNRAPKSVPVSSQRKKFPARQTSLPISDAGSIDWICKSAGHRISVFGQVTEVFHGRTEIGEDHIFVNFGDWREKCFTAVLWGVVLNDIEYHSVKVDSWTGQWINVSGLVSLYNNRPQIQIESLTDIQLLETENNARIFYERGLKEGRYQLKPKNYSSKEALTKNSAILSKKPQSLPFDALNTYRNPFIEDKLNKLYSDSNFRRSKK